MNSSPSKSLYSLLSLIVLLLVGCGGGTSSPPPPPSITFTSAPVTSAEEGVQYSYQLAATSSNSSPVTFSLTASPSGAALSGNAISWTPTHAESRTSNSFTVTATTASGGGATQSWTVTPNGIVNITAVITYWTPSGSINVNPQWIASNPFPAALVPQSDGSLQRLQGAANADGSFSIPNVPAGYYWLEIGPNANYWTSTSDFDDGRDVIGRPPSAVAQSTTTIFASSISGLTPATANGDFFLVKSDLRNAAPLVEGVVSPNSTTFNSTTQATSNIDWSQITTLYLGQFIYTTSGNFTGYLLGPSQTLSNPSFVNGTTNQITATLIPGPSASLPLKVTGSSWAALVSSAGPGTPTLVYSDFAAFVQPYVNDRFASETPTFPLGPDLALLRPAAPATNPVPFPTVYGCGLSVESLNGLTPFTTGLPPIGSDTDFGTLSYSDPYPANWLRMFEYCQVSAVSFPRPNSTVTDTFYVANKQTTALPSSAVTPLLTPVQSPILNGGSLFQSATLSTTTLNLSWTPPAIGQPYGYLVEVYQLVTLPTGATGYVTAGIYGTAKTSLTIPFISPSSTYVFAILAASDANASVEKSPFRHKIPFAESNVVSAPFVIQ